MAVPVPCLTEACRDAKKNLREPASGLRKFALRFGGGIAT